jgi:hypothetical protein
LEEFLKGKADPVVRPESSAVMKRYVEKTKKLSDEERKAIANFAMAEEK